ncbi:MAG: tetratricopeptide repeat protein [Muribaculum sp.]|nr:tetratricopeptide repeat protein [Muribaculaceae bacterium]MCM1080345.1 tetratricopeptide repeat protein [Muribaculum sp.]
MIHKAIFTLLMSVLIPFSAFAQIELTQEADSAYMRDDYGAALSAYEQLGRDYGTSSWLYYNIGNCQYRLGHPGLAIVNYERALRLDPLNGDAKANLEFVNSKITDEPGDRGMFISKTVNAIAQGLPANMWVTIAIISFLLLLTAIAVYIFSSKVALRKVGFFGGILLVIVCICANVMANVATRYSTSSSEAVVTVPSTLLSTSPRGPKDRTEEAMLLHEGTKVEILDSVTTRGDSVSTIWYDVKVDNEHRAWIRGSDVTII